MKKSILLLTISICSLALLSQEKLEKLKTPSSPGASVIGIQPSTILAPKSFKALEANLFSNYVSDAGQPLIPNDVGLEFTPYWFSDPEVNVEDYLLPNPWESLKQNFSVSIASTQNFILGDSSNTNALGVGARTSIYIPTKKNVSRIRSHYMDLKNSSQLKADLKVIANDFLNKSENKDKFIDDYINEIQEIGNLNLYFKDYKDQEAFLFELNKILKKELPDIKPSEADFDNKLNELLDEILNRSEKLNKLDDFKDLKPGFLLDLAGAIALNFPTNHFDYSYVPKSSFWVTVSYQFSNAWSFLKILGVINYNGYNHNFYDKYFPENKFFDHAIDYGIGLNLRYKKFSALIETVGRHSNIVIEKKKDHEGVVTKQSKTESDFQIIANISYQITNGMVVTYSIGNRFEPILEYNGTLVNTLSLNFGFGGPTNRDIKE